MTLLDKFSVIYSFKILDGRKDDFINCWAELSKLIYESEGSYGSRLHRVSDNLFIAYALWPDKETYLYSSNNLSEAATKYRQQMLDCCSEIKVEYELSVVKDLLKNESHNKS